MFDDVDELIRSHEAWSNGFFAYAATGPKWTSSDLAAFGWEYFWFTKAFPGILTQLAARVDDDYLRGFLIEIIYSELGKENRQRMHSELYRRLLSDTPQPPDQGPRLPTTIQLIDGLNELYTSAPLPVALGAQYALERQAENMLQRFHVGFERAGATDFQREFFAVHEVDEPDHITAMQGALSRFLNEHQERPAVLAGVRRCLDLFAGFWEGLRRVLPAQPGAGGRLAAAGSPSHAA